jgi:cyclopropane fatty-acyl-phospholipid synthase-like methyltransferase
MENVYFDFQAEVELRKHSGVRATNELINPCEIESGKHLLDVGCGVGITDIYIAKGHDVIVTGIDLSSNILKWAKTYSKEEEVRVCIYPRIKL